MSITLFATILQLDMNEKNLYLYTKKKSCVYYKPYNIQIFGEKFEITIFFSRKKMKKIHTNYQLLKTEYEMYILVYSITI